MSYASIDGLETKAQDAHIEDSIKIQKLKSLSNKNTTNHCLDCGDLISVKRLKKVPNANYCIECQSEQEKEIKITYKNPYIP